MKAVLKYILPLLGIYLITLNARAQNMQTTIKVQAMDMARALLKNDFEAFTKYMHPKVIVMAGGKEKLVQRMDTANNMFKQFGAQINKVTIGDPAKIITYKSELQTTLPQTTELKSGFGNMTLETTLIAISTNGGKNWYFIDTSVYHEAELKKNLPDLSPDLVIPPMKKPVLTPAQ